MPSTSADQSDEISQPVVVVIAALHLEMAPFLDRVEVRRSITGNGFKFRNCFLNGVRVVVVEGWAGRERARAATNAAIDAFNPDWVISAGLSGGLLVSMRVGHVVVANEVVDSVGPEEISIPVGMQSDPERGLYVGRVCITDHIVHTIEKKEQLREATEAIAVDMESLAVVEVCRKRSVPFMVIRSISDTLEEDLPREVLAIFGSKGTIRAGALIGSLFKRPDCVKDLWKIREQAVKAAKSLAGFLCGVIPQLAETSSRTNQSEIRTSP